MKSLQLVVCMVRLMKYLTFELTAIKTVLPLTEGITAVAGADGSVEMPEDTAIEEE